MRRRTRTALAALLIAGSALASAAPAAAEPPFRVAEQVTDHVGVLAAGRPQVDDALAQLQSEDHQQLWVVYVDSFDGLTGEQWAQQTFDASGFGGDDVLLAVATGDRAYGYHVADSSPLTQDELTAVSRATETDLARSDWPGAVVAGAQSIGEELGGGGATGTSGSAGGSSRTGAVVLVLVVLVLLGVVVALVLRSRRRRAAGPAAAAGPPDPYAGVSTADLRSRTDATLVHADDAVRTSGQELEFARAEFGDDATRPFAAALAAARTALTAAFQQRQLLDDDQPETDAETRALLGRVLQSCEQAGAALDAESGRLEELRNLVAAAPQRLDAVAARLPELEARVEPARAELARLATRFAPTALGSVSANPDEAARRVAAAHEAVEAGRAAVTQATEGDAVVDAVRTAEEATAQAAQLLDAVGRAGADLERATAELPTALLRLRTDLDALGAQGPDPDRRDLAQAAAAARAAVAAGEETGGVDPLGALHRVVEADRALDAAVDAQQAAAREQQQVRALLDQTLLGARAEVDAAEDFIATRRGAVGGTARTRLAEAQRHLDQATALRDGDPAAALEHARTADALAERASAAARADVEQFTGGGFGGGYGGGRSVGSDALLGAVLGGILSGAGGGRRQGGWGGGGFGGGGFGGGGFGGGGFGGGGFGGGGGSSSGGSFGGGGGRSAGGRF